MFRGPYQFRGGEGGCIYEIVLGSVVRKPINANPP